MGENLVEYGASLQKSDISRILEPEIFDMKDRLNLVNPGFQKPGRTRSYKATQKYVVDKSPLLDKVISLIEERHSLKVLEFGIGTGFVIEHLAEKGLLRKIKGFEYTGLDISPEMISCASNVI